MIINKAKAKTMRVLKCFILSAVVVGLAACATGTVVVQEGKKISGPKIVALDAPLAPWVPPIEMRLRDKGFQIKRFSRDQTGALTELSARYVLRLGGGHYTGWKHRCFGGGYKLEYLMAELVDLQTNQAIASVAGEGYTENCPPMSGTIYRDIANMVADRWEN